MNTFASVNFYANQTLENHHVAYYTIKILKHENDAY